MNLVSYSKPYISPVDLKVKFDPMISVGSVLLTCDGAISLSQQLEMVVKTVINIKDYMEKYKYDEEQLRSFVDDFNAGVYNVLS